MDTTPPCGSGMRGAHCKQAAFRPADNSPSRRHFYTRVPTLPMDTVYLISEEIATVYSYSQSTKIPPAFARRRDFMRYSMPLRS